jgi:organic radical activating enzyme
MSGHRVNDKSISTENLDVEKFEQILADCFNPSDTVVEITGGEPTLTEALHPLLEMLSERSFPATILTNCTKISDIPKYDNLKIIGSWYNRFMSLEYLKKQISDCRNDFYMTLYVNRDDRDEMQKTFNELGVKQIAGSWNDDDAVIKLMGLDSKGLNKISITNNVVCKCFAAYKKLLNISKYDGSEKMQSVIRASGCDKCEKELNYTCHIIYKTWQAMNGKEFAIDLSKYRDVRLACDGIKTSSLFCQPVEVL